MSQPELITELECLVEKADSAGAPNHEIIAAFDNALRATKRYPPRRAA